MTAAELAPAYSETHSDAPPNASALVVAIEEYDGYSGEDIPGSAQLAARFVIWLLERKVCRPERITFMVSYDETEYANGDRYDPKPFITLLEEKPAFHGVNILKHARAINVIGQSKADGDFRNWISDAPYRPEGADARFILFWIGHGHAIRGDREQRVFLPCSDATDIDPYNVELVQLLSAITEYAPNADVVGFVQACRNPVPQDAERTLTAKTQEVARRGDRTPVSDLSRKVAVLCAADHGQTTQTAGRDDKIFAQAVLDWLEDPATNANDAIFDGRLRDLVAALESKGFWPGLKGYGTLRYAVQPPFDENLKESEWRRLVTLAEKIDSRRGTTARVRWGAYCQAVGLGRMMHSSDQLPTVKALFEVVSHFQPQSVGAIPPLVVACDFIAELAAKPLSQLAKWCDAWAKCRGDDVRQQLRNIRHERPEWLDDRPYVSIAVKETNLEFGDSPIDNLGHPVYALDSVFFGVSYPERLDRRSFLVWERILEAAEQVIAQALTRQDATQEKLIVEFVLPRGLLGWWLEYGNHEPNELDLGAKHPIVIRDAKRAEAKIASGRRQGRVDWHTCDEVGYENLGMIGVYAMSATCLVLDRNSAGETLLPYDGPTVPRQLIIAIDNGTPVVVSVQPGDSCSGCGRGQRAESGADGCSMLRLRKFLSDEWPDRLDDLPFTLRKVRHAVIDKKLLPVKVSVLMQESTRIWAGYYPLESGFSPKSGSLGSGRRD